MGSTDGDDVQRKVIQSAVAENTRTKALRKNPSRPPSEGRAQGWKEEQKKKERETHETAGSWGQGARIPFGEGGGSQLPWLWKTEKGDICFELKRNGSVVKNPPANAGDTQDVGSIPGSGRSPGEGNGNPLQYSCLGNSMDRGAWQATVYGVTKSWTWLSDWACTHIEITKWYVWVTEL